MDDWIRRRQGEALEYNRALIETRQSWKEKRKKLNCDNWTLPSDAERARGLRSHLRDRTGRRHLLRSRFTDGPSTIQARARGRLCLLYLFIYLIPHRVPGKLDRSRHLDNFESGDSPEKAVK